MPIRTVADVVAAVDRIRRAANDDEGAHNMEDDLYEAVLIAIAIGQVDEETGRGMAMAALKTKALDFARWYA